MQELIKLIESNGEKAVSARDLHEFMGIKKNFTQWMQDQIERGMFDEGVDYQSLTLKVEAGHTYSNKIDYAITLDCAKEISLMSHTEKGKEARKYFIECEKKLKATENRLSPAEFLLHQAQMLVEHERQLQNLDQRVNKLEKSQLSLPVPTHSTILSYAIKKHAKIDKPKAIELSYKAKAKCEQRGVERRQVPDDKYKFLWSYPNEVLEEVFNEYLGTDKNY